MVSLAGLAQSLVEQMTEASAEDLHWQEEVFTIFLGTRTRDPAVVVRREPAPGDDAV